MDKKELIIFEGALCCSTGICGPSPDKALIEINEALKKLAAEYPELKIQRASLSFNPKLFLDNKEIREIVKANGPSILPIIVIDGKIMMKEKYPSYSQLKDMLNA